MAGNINWNAVPDGQLQETWWERLVGLKEALSPRTRQFIANAASRGWNLTKQTFKLAKSATWAVAMGTIVILMPYVVLTEMDEVERAQLQRQRDLLLGPTPAAGEEGANN